MIKAYNAVVEFIPGLKVIETAAAGAVGSLSDLGKQGFEYVSEKVEIFKDNLIGMIPPVLIGEIRNLQDEITMAGLTYDRAEKQAKALSQTVGYQDRIMRLAAVATAELAAKQTLLRKAIAAAAIEVNAFTDFWTDLKAELFPTEIAITLIKEQIDKLKIAIAGGHMEADKMIESVKLLEAQLTKLTTAGGESTKKIEDQAQAFKDKLQQMQDSYFPLEAATRRYKEEVLFLNEALDEGLISEERHAESLKKAKEIHGDLYDYSLVDYKNEKTDVAIICKIHNVLSTMEILLVLLENGHILTY
jgi:chromosome segregation ATPase